MSKKTNKYSPEVRERAVRMVVANDGQHGSVTEACVAFERFSPLKSMSALRFRWFGWDRGTSEVDVKRLGIGIQTGQRVVDHLPDLAQRVPREDTLVQINIAEQRLVRPPHHHRRRYRLEVNHVSKSLSRRDYFSGLSDVETILAITNFTIRRLT